MTAGDGSLDGHDGGRSRESSSGPGRRLVAGVDGAPGGWIVATATAAPFEVLRVDFAATIAPVVDRLAAGSLDVVTVDMPIGLPDEGCRRCDLEARRELGRRRASVFLTPPRPVLAERVDHATASEACRRTSGRGLSQQAFRLLDKVDEVDRDLRSRPPQVVAAVWEAHPELAFARRAGAPLRHPKRTAAGVVERLDLLGEAGIDWRRWLEDPPAGGGDDVIDALVLVLLAADLATGRPVVVLGGGEVDGLGFPMRITG